MGWDRKPRGRAGGYYYRSVRVPGRAGPVKVYLGAGPAAAAAAAAVADRRAAAEEARARAVRVARLDAQAAALAAVVSAALHAALTAAGYREHRGCWRRLRRGAPGTTTEGTMPRKRTRTEAHGEPTSPDRPWGWLSDGGRRSTLRELADRVARGDADARKQMALMTAEYPELLSDVGTLADRAEGAFADAIGAGDPVAAAAARAEADRVRADVGGPAAAGLEKLAVDLVVVNYLADRHAQLDLAATTADPATAAARCRRAGATGRRMLDAVRLLALVRAKRPDAPATEPPDRYGRGAGSFRR